MRIVAMTNEGQLPMMKNMLNSAIKAGWPLSMFHCYIVGSQAAAAKYNTPEFQSLTLKKLEVILDNMHQDNEVLWIDNDIYLFQNTIAEMRSITGHFVMQDDLWSPCTGFFLVRASPASFHAIQKSIQYIRQRLPSGINDQHAFSVVYKRILGLRVSTLPQDEYPNGEIYFNQRKTEKAKMVHCNYLLTTAEKVERFKLFNLWDESDTGYEIVNKYFI
jgi:hypothetical protein